MAIPTDTGNNMKTRRHTDDKGVDDFFVMLDPGSYDDLSARITKSLKLTSLTSDAWYERKVPWRSDPKTAVIYENLAVARVSMPRELLSKEFGDQNVAANFELQVPEVSVGPAPPLSSMTPCFDETLESWSRQITDPLPKTQLDGNGVKVCVIDTGITVGHVDFSNRPRSRDHMRSFVPFDPGGIKDLNGHGTHCAGIICGKEVPGMMPRYGIAPGVELFVANVFGDATITTVDLLLDALNWAFRKHCDIVSMSLYSTPQADQDQQTRDDALKFERLANRALANGTVLIACTGNSSDRKNGIVGDPGFPAKLSSVLAVGGINSCRQIMNESNRGASIVGPGMEVWSANNDDLGFTFMSGTSMATANVAGIAALHAQTSSSLRGAALLSQLKNHVEDLGLPAQDMGAGLALVP